MEIMVFFIKKCYYKIKQNNDDIFSINSENINNYSKSQFC